MRKAEILEQFLTKSDREIQDFAYSYGVKLSIEEIQRLRPIAENASVTWLFTGIPPYVLQDIENIIGRKKLKKLMQFLN